jgi:hypothetical protein
MDTDQEGADHRHAMRPDGQFVAWETERRFRASVAGSVRRQQSEVYVLGALAAGLLALAKLAILPSPTLSAAAPSQRERRCP